jgi:hypothetical protein
MTTATTYNPKAIPANPNGSRFALQRTPEGWPVNDSTECFAIIAERLTQELTEATPEALPETVKVELSYVALIEGEYQLVPRGAIERIPERQGQRPTKFGKTKLEGGALLDSFLLGEPEGYGKATDRQVWLAVVKYANEAQPTTAALRRLCDAVALAVCLRAGLVVRKDALPLPDHLKAER